MLDIIKTLLEHQVLAVLIIPEVLKQLREWHLGYLDRKPKQQRLTLCLEPDGSSLHLYNIILFGGFQL